MAAFDSALTCLKKGTHDLLSPQTINQHARELGVEFRDTKLTPGNTLQLFVQQIAHGNIACDSVRYLAGQNFTDSAWCEARKRLKIELIHQVNQRVLEQVCQAAKVDPDATLWHGHRVLVMDGSSDSMPDTAELREHYGVPGVCKEGLGFPTSHLMLLMDHRSGVMFDCHDWPGDTHDASVAHLTHNQLHPGDLIMGDDAFASYLHPALLLQAQAHAIVPAHHHRVVDFTPGREFVPSIKNTFKSSAGKPRSEQVEILGKDDQLVRYFKPLNRPRWMTARQWESIPDSIVVREIRRKVRRDGFRPITVTVVTTLPDPIAYPADQIIELRLTRWMIETNIRHLKITLGMDQLKCKSLIGVRKERSVFLLVYNMIRLIMVAAARRQGVKVNRISFADTLYWLRMGNIEELPRLRANPLRPGRLEPRAIKRQKKQFPYMTRPRATLQIELRATYGDTT